MVERYGRKFTLIAVSLPFMVGWSQIYYGGTVNNLYMGKELFFRIIYHFLVIRFLSKVQCTLIAVSLPFMVGWSQIYYGGTVNNLYMGRFTLIAVHGLH